MADDPFIPDPLARALREAIGTPSGFPAERDEAVRELIAERAAGLARRRMVFRVAGPLAAAAGIALAAYLALPGRVAPSRSPAPAPVARAADPDDINGDGTVNILDALALARLAQPGAARPAGVDLDRNQDGVVDERDADAIARAAVRLRQEGQG
jgi:hypothetical protein